MPRFFCVLLRLAIGMVCGLRLSLGVLICPLPVGCCVFKKASGSETEVSANTVKLLARHCNMETGKFRILEPMTQVLEKNPGILDIILPFLTSLPLLTLSSYPE